MPTQFTYEIRLISQVSIQNLPVFTPATQHMCCPSQCSHSTLMSMVDPHKFLRCYVPHLYQACISPNSEMTAITSPINRCCCVVLTQVVQFGHFRT